MAMALLLGLACLRLLGHVDAVKADALASYLDGIAVDDPGLGGDVGVGREGQGRDQGGGKKR